MTRLGTNVVASTLTVGFLIASSLVSVPLILAELGLAAYGAWTLAQTLIVYVTTAEAGVGPAVQRFVAVAQGQGDAAATARLLWSSLALYGLLGGALALIAQPLAAAIVAVIGLEPDLRGDAEAMYRLVGVALALTLLAAAFGNVQQGLEQFGGYAVSALVASVVFLAAVIGFLAAGLGLVGLALAAVVQQGALLLVRAIDVRHVLAAGPRFATRAEARAVLGFAARLQITVLSLLVNTQTDKLVVGAVASPATLGQLGIGAQVAESGRLVGGAALSPVVSRLSVVHGEGSTGGAERLFARLNRLWTLAVIGGIGVGLGSLYPLIRGWLGAGHGEAAALGAFLVLAYGLALLTGPGVAYLRARGRPRLEARYGLFLVAVNVLLTVALGVAFGAYGVVAATAGTYALGTVWYFAQLRGEAPEIAHVELFPGVSTLLAAAVAAAASGSFGLAMVQLLPQWVALVPVVLGAIAAYVSFLARTTGVRPTPRGVRAALEGT